MQLALLRSDETEKFDLVEFSKTENWFLWRGKIKKGYKIGVSCAEVSTISELMVSLRHCMNNHLTHTPFEISVSMILNATTLANV